MVSDICSFCLNRCKRLLSVLVSGLDILYGFVHFDLSMMASCNFLALLLLNFWEKNKMNKLLKNRECVVLHESIIVFLEFVQTAELLKILFRQPTQIRYFDD